jgi:NAD-dependent deacetylase
MTELERARALLAPARSLMVLTGAGMSADSGVPTFRDAQTGLWARFDPYELASPAGFRANPELVWNWYAWRRQLVSQALPNAGHRALAKVQAGGRFASFTLATQNVDGLHAAAGSADVLELHGSILGTHCFNGCGVRYSTLADLPPGAPPRCPRCGGPLRPSVVWFGESLDPGVLDAAQHAAGQCDAMLVVGTSGLVHPAAGLPMLARRAGARVIVVNPEATELDDLADVRIPAGAAVALPALLAPL